MTQKDTRGNPRDQCGSGCSNLGLWFGSASKFFGNLFSVLSFCYNYSQAAKMISTSHHVKSNKIQFWAEAPQISFSPMFVCRKCFPGVKACGLHASETGDWNSNSDWTLTPVLDCHFKVWGALLQIPPCWSEALALLVQCFAGSVAGSHDPGGMWKLSLWRTNQDKLLLSWVWLMSCFHMELGFSFQGVC